MASRRQNVPLSELLNGDDRGAPQQPHQEAPAYFPQQPRQDATAHFPQQPRQEATAHFPQQPHQEAVVGSRSPAWVAHRQAARRGKAIEAVWIEQQPHQEAVVGSRSPVWAAYRQAARREKAAEVIGIEQHAPAVRQVTYQSRGTSMHTTPPQIQSHPHGVRPQINTATFQIQSHPHRAGPKKKKQWEWAPPVLSFEEWVKK